MYLQSNERERRPIDEVDRRLNDKKERSNYGTLWSGYLSSDSSNGPSRSVTAKATQKEWMLKPGAPRTTSQKLTIITGFAVSVKRVWNSYF